MGVGSRTFQTFLCDACGREVIAEEGSSVDGYYIEVLKVVGGERLGTENVYACAEMCIDRAIRDALKRETLPPEKKLTATEELWLKGRSFNTNPRMAVYNAQDDTRLIGTAQEIASYQPPQEVESESDPLSPDWTPEFRGKPR